MKWLLLFVSVFLGSTKSILSKRVNNDAKGLKKTMLANVGLFFFAFCFIAVFAIFSLDKWSLPWGLTIAYAVCVLLSQISLMKAVELGSVAISSLFYSCGFIIPTIWGCIYFQEGFNILHIIGIVMILVSFIISVEKKEDKPFNWKWLIASLGGTFFSGLVGVVQKLFGAQPINYSLDLFLCASFAIIILLSGGIILLCHIFENKKSASNIEHVKIDIKTLVFTLLLGFTIGGVNKLNTYLAGVLPSVIMFPTANGGVILTTACFSALFYKEKLSKKQIFSVLIGFLAIIVIAIGQNV